MKRLANVVLGVALVMMIAGCASAMIDSSGGRDGSSAGKAVIVGSVRSEYIYIDREWPGANIKSQVVKEQDGKTFDVVSIRTKEGTDREVWFDISKLYVKKVYPEELKQ